MKVSTEEESPYQQLSFDRRIQLGAHLRLAIKNMLSDKSFVSTINCFVYSYVKGVVTAEVSASYKTLDDVSTFRGWFEEMFTPREISTFEQNTHENKMSVLLRSNRIPALSKVGRL